MSLNWEEWIFSNGVPCRIYNIFWAECRNVARMFACTTIVNVLLTEILLVCSRIIHEEPALFLSVYSFSFMTFTLHHAELRVLEIPLKHPFTISGGTIRMKTGVLLTLFTRDGLVGYGEAAVMALPIYLSETVAGAQAFLRDGLWPHLRGREISLDPQDPLEGIRAFSREFDIFKGFEFSKSAVVQALCHIVAQIQNVSLQTLFGGTQKKIDVGESLGINSVQDTLAEVKLRLQQGYKRIKLKIKPGHDQAVVEAVRAAHPDIVLMVDANSAYTLTDVASLKALDVYHLLMIEQPLSHDDILDHAALAKKIRTPICLDESILSLRHARQAIDSGAAAIINIKPGRVGGPLEAIAIHHLCTERGIPVWCGGMLESGIGRAFNIALASLPGFTLPADMSPSSLLFDFDLVSDPYEVMGGEIPVPTTPGLGFTVDAKAIDRATVTTDILSA